MIRNTTCAISLSLLFFPAYAFGSDVSDLAASLIGRPYVWGAEGPNAFDCSGLTQYVYREFGVDLPRRAVSQSAVGDRIIRRLQRGDLVFFSTHPRQSVVTHVGIYEGGGNMIDASQRYGRVRRTNLNDEFWVARFMFARRIMSDEGSWDDGRERRSRTDDDEEARPPVRASDARRAAARVLAEIAGRWIRRPGR